MIEVYPVGLLRDLRSILLPLRLAITGRDVPRREALRFAQLRARVLRRHFPRDCRRRSYWNGYLAEPRAPFPEQAWTRAGHGWAKARARRSLARHVLARLEGSEG